MSNRVQLTIKERLARYHPVEFKPSLQHLSSNQRLAVTKLVQASAILDTLYMQQAWSKNAELHTALKQDPTKKDELLFFELSKGPWDRILNNEPFLDDVPPRPLGGNFYPEDMTRDEYSAWLATLSKEEAKKAAGFYHVIRRTPSGRLVHVPYSEAYRQPLTSASDLLHEAAHLVENASLKDFLLKRATSFWTNEYVSSELAWLAIDDTSPIEVTCGPYEVYTDALYAAKAAFESYVHLRDFDSSDLLKKFGKALQDIERHLPVPDEYKNPDLKATPIVVVNQLYAGGDVAVPMTAAYNLPNDEEAIQRGGSKLVIIKNVQQAKFEHILKPIASIVLAPEQLKYLEFEAFFTHILLHEVSHSNGPHYVIGPGHGPVRSHLQEFHSAMEEAKADITGLFAAAYLSKKGVIHGISMKAFYVTFLASAFRSIRFGLEEAHGLGQAAQLNYLVECGAFECVNGRFCVNFFKVEKGVEQLTHDILLLQGNGDKAVVKTWLAKYGVLSPEVAALLDQLREKQVPVDIRPIYHTL
jgi:hypothetical protein